MSSGIVNRNSGKGMSWHTQFARRAFPKEQTFMARRKLAQLIWALVVGLLVSAAMTGAVWLSFTT